MFHPSGALLAAPFTCRCKSAPRCETVPVRTARRTSIISLAVAGTVTSLLLVGCGSSKSAAPSSTTATTVADGVAVMPVETIASGMSDSVPSGPPEGTKQFAGLKQDHTPDPVTYDQAPPVGGPHNPRWQACGYYDAPIQNERGVHSMEHGAVWITYSPDLAADQVAVLRALTDGRSHVLVSPYPGLPSPVVASAWGEQLTLDSVADPRLAEFVSYFEQGPQTPEPGATCS